VALTATRFMPVSCLDYTWTLKKETTLPPKRQLTLNGLHGVISQKTEFSEILRFMWKMYSFVAQQEVSRGNLKTCLCSILVSQIGFGLSGLNSVSMITTPVLIS
jgi:hypothetical protein